MGAERWEVECGTGESVALVETRPSCLWEEIKVLGETKAKHC